jgi:hypothetical protein
VHDYFGVDVAIIYDILSNDLQPLQEEVEKIIKSGIADNTFDSEELIISKGSAYYRHIDFTRLEAPEEST